jgi:hypothetical protein
MGDRGRKKTTYSLGDYIGPDKGSNRGSGGEICKFHAEGGKICSPLNCSAKFLIVCRLL